MLLLACAPSHPPSSPPSVQIGFLGPAFFLTQLGGITTVKGAVACMMAAQGLDAFSQSGLYSNHADIGPQYAGVLLGLSNTAGVLAGVLGTAATGFILQNGTWDQVGAAAWATWAVGEWGIGCGWCACAPAHSNKNSMAGRFVPLPLPASLSC